MKREDLFIKFEMIGAKHVDPDRVRIANIPVRVRGTNIKAQTPCVCLAFDDPERGPSNVRLFTPQVKVRSTREEYQQARARSVMHLQQIRAVAREWLAPVNMENTSD